MKSAETLEAPRQRLEDRLNDYKSAFSPVQRPPTTRLYMKALTSERDQDKWEPKDQEGFKQSLAAAADQRAEGDGTAYRNADLGYPATLDGLKDKIAIRQRKRKALQSKSDLKSLATAKRPKIQNHRLKALILANLIVYSVPNQGGARRNGAQRQTWSSQERRRRRTR